MFLKRFIKILRKKVNISSLEVNNVSATPDEACVLSVTIIMRIFMNFKQYIQYRIFLHKW